MPAPQPEASRTPAAPSAAAILARPDHRIYITTGSHLMIPHPRGEELLERLDHMLYIAAHRDGDPFIIPPALDDSLPVMNGAAIVPPPFDDGGIDPSPLCPLPPADDALWLARVGHVFTRLEPQSSPRARPMPEPIVEPMPEDETFAAGIPHALPPPDGALWVLRLGRKPERVVGT